MRSSLLVKFPSRFRPRLFSDVFLRWNAVPDAVKFLVSLDEDDPSLPAYRDFLKDKPNVTAVVGHSRNKVHACNRDIDAYGEPWETIVLASDDMTPQRSDWAARVLSLMARHFPDGDGVLHLNDGRTGRTLNTLCICGRAYYERTGYLYNPEFSSVFCDNEWQEVSERLGRAVYVDEVLIRHDWIGSTQPDDALHRRNEGTWKQDEATFNRRLAWGFPSRPA